MELVEELAARRAVVVVRAPRIDAPDRLADALASASDALVEITLTVEDALPALERIAARSDLVTGAGTVLDAAQAEAAITAGARFLVTPAAAPDVVEAGRRAGVPVIVGAFSPSEVLAAWRGGAAAVKVFPAGIGGHGYLRELAGPLPDLPLVPSGGVGTSNAAAFLDAGAVAVTCGSSVVAPEAVASGDWDAIAERAAALEAAVAPYRGSGR
jgi:2-dehydro-3-deoxyphosphogluconate aldolase/(4S)-4-hydroxy-2-oxoglutarate aldolase